MTLHKLIQLNHCKCLLLLLITNMKFSGSREKELVVEMQKRQ